MRARPAGATSSRRDRCPRPPRPSACRRGRRRSRRRSRSSAGTSCRPARAPRARSTLSGAPRKVVVAPGSGREGADPPHDRVGGIAPVDRALLGGELRRVGRAGVVLRASAAAVPASSARSDSSTQRRPELRESLPRGSRVVVGPIGSSSAVEHRPGVEPLVEQHHAHPGGLVALEDRPLHGRRAAPPGQQREVQVHGAEPRHLEHLGAQDLAVGDDDHARRAECARSRRARRPVRTPSASSTGETEPRARPRRPRVGRSREPRPGGPRRVRDRRGATSMSGAAASASRVGTDQGSLPRKTHAQRGHASARRRSRRFGGGSSSPSSMRRSSAITERRPSSSRRSM